MSSTFLPPTIPSPNRPLTLNPTAIEYLCQYPFASTRKDLSNSQRIVAQYEWNTFNSVWAYNYTASTINGEVGSRVNSPWQFQNYKEKSSYENGQLAHIAYYSTVGAAGGFNNIAF